MAESSTPRRSTTRGAKTSIASPAASGAPQTKQIYPEERTGQPLDVVNRSTEPNVSDASTNTVTAAVATTATTATATTNNANDANGANARGARLDVRVNTASVAQAFYELGRSRTVGIMQHLLNERGFELVVDGVAGYKTRATVAEFQRQRGDAPTGIPDAELLDLLGFDVVG